MCYFEQSRWACGYWRWGNFRQQCNKEYRTGETCGLKLVYQTTFFEGPCKICDKNKQISRRVAKMYDNIYRWQREAHISTTTIATEEARIYDLNYQICNLEASHRERERSLEGRVDPEDAGGVGFESIPSAGDTAILKATEPQGLHYMLSSMKLGPSRRLSPPVQDTPSVTHKLAQRCPSPPIASRSDASLIVINGAGLRDLKPECIDCLPGSENSTLSEETSNDSLSDITDEDSVLADNHLFMQYRPTVLFLALRGLRSHAFRGNSVDEGLLVDQASVDHNELHSPNDLPSKNWTQWAGKCHSEGLSFGMDLGAAIQKFGGAEPSTRGSGTRSGGKGTCAPEGNTNSKGNKRPYSGNDNADNKPGKGKDRADPSPGSKRIKVEPNNNSLKQLACIFYKHDKLRHLNCLKFSLKRVKDVKQHIWRKHRQPQLYCPTCYLVFDPVEERPEHDSHVQTRSCSAQPRPAWDGVTERQRSFLSQRETAGPGDVEAQWFSVWDKIFPEKPRPRSPYVESGFTEYVEMVRDYWTRSGPEIISDVLSSRDLLNWGVPNEERDLATFHEQLLPELIDVVVNALLDRSGGGTTAPSASNSDDHATASREGRPAAPVPASFSPQGSGVAHDPSPERSGRDGASSSTGEPWYMIETIPGGPRVEYTADFLTNQPFLPMAEDTSHNNFDPLNADLPVWDDSDVAHEARELVEATRLREIVNEVEEQPGYNYSFDADVDADVDDWDAGPGFRVPET